MKWLWKMICPARRVLGGVASRINFRQSGLLKLRSDVRACEYEDVRVMWEMLKRNETELVRSDDGSRKRQIWLPVLVAGFENSLLFHRKSFRSPWEDIEDDCASPKYPSTALQLN